MIGLGDFEFITRDQYHSLMCFLKSDETHKVLQLMDEDHTYCEALDIVLKKNPTIDKAELTKELDIFI
jgi:DNA-directed RNA polymerase subunit L